MTTDFGEVPLINMANVMLAALKLAAARPAVPGDCVEQIARNLAKVHENPEAQRAELEARVELAFVELLAAGLIEEVKGGGFQLTARGRTVLENHPMGVDESVLAEFREFRDFVKKHDAPVAGGDAAPLDATSSRAYLDGYGAFGGGKRATENPHPPDMAEHMAWDAGWFEAFDESVENTSVPDADRAEKD